ncbi:sensory protein TspO [Camelimonas fluminis]|uniref:TspO/MBR family protein n=1 Tax=Camelimonas fluminis TaxID=1576911 RepID=A0ABV7UI45_9HYPH|nr:TspO/MBR family protein [Camelimonas fluminis]GHE62978.1 sensory protein TspO [Camelimonas fluminis]
MNANDGQTANQAPAKPPMAPWKIYVIAIAPVLLTLVLGQVATFPNLDPWYAGLRKPHFNPPNAVFGPVWTLLYALMAFAIWRVLNLPKDTVGKGLGVTLFYIQLALNAAWSWLFFGAHSPRLGLVNIVIQLFFIVLTVSVFRRLDKVAALCLVPLLGWVAFATLLNFSIWKLNG